MSSKEEQHTNRIKSTVTINGRFVFTPSYYSLVKHVDTFQINNKSRHDHGEKKQTKSPYDVQNCQRNDTALIKGNFFRRDRVPQYTTSEHHWMILSYQGLERTITGRVSRLRGLRSGMHSLII